MSLNDYELLELKGKGGQGEVWKAKVRKTGQIAALKIIPANLDPTALKFANSELAALERISFPTCNRFLACYYNHYYDTNKQVMLIEMEYVEGVTLEQWAINFKRNNTFRFFIHVLKKLILDLSIGLNDIHSRGLVHRDIKPGNIIIQPNNSPKIIDFGLACRDKCELPRQALLCCKIAAVGTPEFMAPETAIYGESYFASDVWGLGSTLYRLITGHYVFDFGGLTNLKDKFMVIANSDIPTLNTGDEEIDTIVNKSLVRNHLERISIPEIQKILN